MVMERGGAGEGDEGVKLQLEPWSKKERCDGVWEKDTCLGLIGNSGVDMGCKKEIIISKLGL